MGYDKSFTDALEFAWGEGFLSPGGPEEVEALLDGLDVTGKRVLDVGSGLGGVDLLIAARHSAGEVVGIDVDPRLVETATARAARRGLEGRVRYQLVEPGPLPFEARSFDVVFSKDAMIHFPDKPAIYGEVLRVLRPGGLFVASDWLFAPNAAESPAIRKWIPGNPLGFVFTTSSEAERTLKQAGFRDVRVRDRRTVIQTLNREEIATLEGPGIQRLAAIVGEDFSQSRLHSAWGRQGALDSGDLIPSHLRAWKPAN